MMRNLIRAALVGAATVTGAFTLVCRNQTTALEHLHELEKMQRDKNEETSRLLTSDCVATRAYAQDLRARDTEWYNRETAILEAWLYGPRYRQLGFVPFPDYAQVK